MPRQGDSSSDDGPFEEAKHDIIDGARPHVVSEHQSSIIFVKGTNARYKLTVSLAPKRLPQSQSMRKAAPVEVSMASGGGNTLPEVGNPGKGLLK
jgi:hypothetical protein